MRDYVCVQRAFAGCLERLYVAREAGWAKGARVEVGWLTFAVQAALERQAMFRAGIPVRLGFWRWSWICSFWHNETHHSEAVRYGKVSRGNSEPLLS
jgi:hypothetical protein